MFLNVECNWLWQTKDHLSFDVGYRVQPFSKCLDEVRFATVAGQIAERAAEEIINYRQMFPDIHAVCRHYIRNHPQGFWENFHAGTACGLAGEPNHAKRFFAVVATTSTSDELPWAVAARTDAEQLSALSSRAERFRQLITARVRQSRELNKLPLAQIINFG